jgi:chemotaxis signal transduction protein
MVSNVNSAYIRGIAKLENRLVTLLDLTRVLSLEEQAVLQKTSSAV